MFNSTCIPGENVQIKVTFKEPATLTFSKMAPKASRALPKRDIQTVSGLSFFLARNNDDGFKTFFFKIKKKKPRTNPIGSIGAGNDVFVFQEVAVRENGVRGLQGKRGL